MQAICIIHNRVVLVDQMKLLLSCLLSKDVPPLFLFAFLELQTSFRRFYLSPVYSDVIYQQHVLVSFIFQPTTVCVSPPLQILVSSHG